MRRGETQLDRNRRKKSEEIARVLLLSGITVAIGAVAVKYLPNSFTSEPVKPPTTTEQVIDNPHQDNISSSNIEKQP